MKKLLNLLRSKDLHAGIARYILSLWMLPYAVTKILRTQFVLLPFALWQQPIESLSGKNIAWAFLGYSPWFQVLLGVLEFVPSILLLFRRTATLGAILLLPMTLSVFLINQALDLWDTTKQVSLILLILNCLILIFNWQTIKKVFLSIIQKGLSFKYFTIELIFNSIIILIALFFSVTDLLGYKDQTNSFTGNWYYGHPNEWILQTEMINDSITNKRLLKCYFGTYGEYSEINDTGLVNRGIIEYNLDEKKQVIEFVNMESNLKNKFNYIITDSTLHLEKIMDHSNNEKIEQTFIRRIINAKAPH